MPRPPVFIHSSFRTASTWLWLKFRADEAYLAFYEPFNEALSGLAKAELLGRSPHTWSSGHSDSDPYFLEYATIADDLGVRLFRDAFAFDDFFAAPLPHEQISYLNQLHGLAHEHGKVPVLGCVRSLGRIAGLKSVLGGIHILLVRALYDQWLSYSAMNEEGNPYFVRSVARTLRCPTLPSFLKPITDRYVKDSPDKPFASMSDAFAAFLFLHIALYASAANCADLLIDVTSAAIDSKYSSQIERQINVACGTRLSLADARRTLAGTRAPLDYAQVNEIIEAVSVWISTLTPAPHPIASRLLSELRHDIENDRLFASPVRRVAAAHAAAIQETLSWRITSPLRHGKATLQQTMRRLLP